MPLFVFDAGCDPTDLTHTFDDVNCWYASATTECSTPTRPSAPSRRSAGHAATRRRFKCGDPDDELTVDDPNYGTVTVTAAAAHKLGRCGR